LESVKKEPRVAFWPTAKFAGPVGVLTGATVAGAVVAGADVAGADVAGAAVAGADVAGAAVGVAADPHADSSKARPIRVENRILLFIETLLLLKKLEAYSRLSI
jgi:uncharacterized protein YjbI with pentapeptide repeats